MKKALEVLNYYRNCHYNEPDGTKEKELADAINEILPRFVSLQETTPLTKKSVGDTVWWVHCTNKVYKGTIVRIECCEYQGALYCLLDSPDFKINPNPVVHYSNVFLEREDALSFAEYQKENPDGVVPMCMGCHYAFRAGEDKKCE